MIKIVGSFLGIHDNGFSLIENNNIVACYSDERFSRVKSAHRQYTFPQPSLDAIQKDFNINIKDSNIILASAKPVNTSLPQIVDIVNHRPIRLYSHQYSHACGVYYTSGFDDNTLVVSYDGGDCGDDNFVELNKNNLHKYFPYKMNTYGACYIVKIREIKRTIARLLTISRINKKSTVVRYQFSRAIGHLLGIQSFHRFFKILNFIPICIDQEFSFKKIIF